MILLEDLENAFLNIITAHKIYLNENSEYTKDTETLENIIYQEMKEKGEESKFFKIAKENDIEIKIN